MKHGSVAMILGCFVALFLPGCHLLQKPGEIGTTQSENSSSTGEPSQATTAPEGQPTDAAMADKVQNYLNGLPKSDTLQNGTTSPSDNVSSPDGHVASMSSMAIPDTSAANASTRTARKPNELAVPSLVGVSVQSTEEPSSGTAAPDHMASPNTAANTQMLLTQDSIRREIEKLEEETQGKPDRDLQKLFRLYFLYLATGQKDKALTIPDSLDPERAKLLNNMIRTVLVTEMAMQDPGTLTPEMVESVRDWSQWIDSKAELQVPRVALCSKIECFGRYEALPADYFKAGLSLPACLYVEVKNFASEQDENSLFVTKITHRLELLTPEGQTVWSDNRDWEVVDRCVNRRMDFFFNRLWYLPEGLGAGEYVLKVTVEDKLKSQVDEVRYRIQVQPK